MVYPPRTRVIYIWGLIFAQQVQQTFSFRKMLNLQHQHNNHTTTPHMRVDLTHWGPL
jgi:hypothetical protein